jgi:hypothetical protein
MKLGELYVSKRSKSGRVWEATGFDVLTQRVTMQPKGDDVHAARNAKTGKWQGGVRRISVSVIDFEKRWARV